VFHDAHIGGASDCTCVVLEYDSDDGTSLTSSVTHLDDIGCCDLNIRVFGSVILTALSLWALNITWVHDMILTMQSHSIFRSSAVC